MDKKKRLNARLEKLKKIIVPILKKNNIARAGIFGSFVRGDYKKESDVDILIKAKSKKFSLFDLVGIEMELKKALGRNIDLLTYKGINHLLKDRILKEEVRIL